MPFRKFIARRGHLNEIRRDSGTNFKAGERELRETIHQWNQEKVKEFLCQRNIHWIFMLHHISEVYGKVLLDLSRRYALLRNQAMDDEELQTLMCKVEAILNKRPLTLPVQRGGGDDPPTVF